VIVLHVSNETSIIMYDILISLVRRAQWRSERGQATTEYALVLLAAALVGLLVIAWATTGGGAAAISGLFDRVIQSVIDRV
jgi:Flp pilus assembly pilin Flp